jgi:hypothetical protein
MLDLNRYLKGTLEGLPVVIAAFFLLAPITVLLVMAHRHHDPAADYARAVLAAMEPDKNPRSHSLLSVNPDQPLTVVSWKLKTQVKDYQDKTAPADTWITVAPNLKKFCQDYVTSNGNDPDQLKLRLEQRLGLPPNSTYDSFVEFTIDPKDVSKFFRPCDDPSTSTNTCDPASPPKPYEVRANLNALKPGNNQAIEKYWLLSNYYWSYAPSHEYPWTSLGYTFDWAPKEEGSDDFVRVGESEFVVAAGTPIQFVSAADTAAYCTPH